MARNDPPWLARVEDSRGWWITIGTYQSKGNAHNIASRLRKRWRPRIWFRVRETRVQARAPCFGEVEPPARAGRERPKGECYSRALRCDVTEAEYQRVAAVARALDETVAEWLRITVRRALDEAEA